MKKIVLFSIVIVLLFLSHICGVFDRVGIYKNRVEVSFSNKINVLDKISVSYVNNQDTFLLVKNKTIYFSKIDEDFYGKDHIFVKISDRTVKCKLNKFKKKSWEKVKLKITIDKDDKENFIVNWKMKTLSDCVEKSDTISATVMSQNVR